MDNLIKLQYVQCTYIVTGTVFEKIFFCLILVFSKLNMKRRDSYLSFWYENKIEDIDLCYPFYKFLNAENHIFNKLELQKNWTTAKKTFSCFVFVFSKRETKMKQLFKNNLFWTFFKTIFFVLKFSSGFQNLFCSFLSLNETNDT